MCTSEDTIKKYSLLIKKLDEQLKVDKNILQ